VSQKAIILEVNKKYCTVITSGGDFRKLRMSGNFRAGQEIMLPESRPGLYRYALAAACLAFIIFTAGLWKFWTLPAVAAYVCLDINPSVEMALDKNSVVRGVNPLNDDGKNLVDGMDLEGKDIREAVEDLVLAALDKKYILPGEENVVMSSVVPESKTDAPVIEAMVRESIDASLQGKNIQAEVAVLEAPPEVREEAGKAGMSTGRYMLYLSAREKGADVSPGDFKNKSIRLIEKEQRIKVSEIEKSPPGHWKDRIRDQYQLPGAAENMGEYGKSKKPDSRPDGSAEKPGGGVKPVGGNNKTSLPDRDKGKDNNSGGYSREAGEDRQDSRYGSGGGSRKGNSGDKQDKGKDMSGGNKNGQGDKDTGGNRGSSDKGHDSSGSAVSGGNGGADGKGGSDRGGSDKGGSGKDKSKD